MFDDNHNNNNNNNDYSGSKLQNSNTHTQTDRIQRLEKMVQLLLDYRYFLFPSVLHACMWVCMWQISFVWVDFILTSFVLSFQTFEMGLFMIVVAVVVDLRFPLGQLKEKKKKLSFVSHHFCIDPFLFTLFLLAVDDVMFRHSVFLKRSPLFTSDQNSKKENP